MKILDLCTINLSFAKKVVFEALASLQTLGFKLIVVTNQAGITVDIILNRNLPA